MSWLDKIKTSFTITCGDGAQFVPLWVEASKAFEFNVSEFEFIDVAGTYVHRKKIKGKRYNLNIKFQGENHLDVADAFEKSSEDEHAWTIAHPLYGSLKVQPIAFVRDNTRDNVTTFTGQVVETIDIAGPQGSVAPEDKIAEDTLNVNDALADSYAGDVKPKVKDVQDMQKNTRNVYAEGKKKLNNTLDGEKYYNAFNNANSYITRATSEPLAAIRQVQNLINAPAHFADSVKNRMSMLQSQMEQLRKSISGSLSYAAKKLFENNAGTVITTMALSTVTGITGSDYGTRKSVLDTIAALLQAHAQYLDDIDGLQAVNGSSPGSYIPNAGAIIQLGNLVNFTVNNLFAVANSSKQERTLYLPEDTNVVSLAFKLYGLKEDDSTIDLLVQSNELDYNDMLQLKKGRKIIYYV